MTRNEEYALAMVRAARILCIDVETSGLDWKTRFVCGWAISDGSDSVYVPVRHGGGGNAPGCAAPDSPTAPRLRHPFERALERELRQRPHNWRIVNQNIRFDMHHAHNHDVWLGENVSCTMNNQCLIDEHTERFSLEYLSQLYKVTAKKGVDMYRHLANKFGCKPDHTSMEHLWKLPGTDPVVVEYACADALAACQVYYKQVEEIDNQGLSTVCALEDQLIPVLWRMERRGIKIDEARLAYNIGVAEDLLKHAELSLPDGFNPRSSKDVKAYVEQFRTDWPLTPAGNPSFPKKWLDTFPEGRHVTAPRKWGKVLDSFLRPIRDEHIFQGRVHPSIHQNRADEHGTISGRLSCSNPNMFAITKHDRKAASIIRENFVADDGKRIAEPDYSQAEPRLFAHYTNCQRLLEGYNADPPKDVHAIVAEMFKVDRGTTGKRMNMGMFTGMSAKTLAGHMEWDYQYAADMHRAWFDLFPEIRDFQDRKNRRSPSSVMLRRGYVKTLLGRRARLDQPRFAYRAVSRIIQGGNADIMKHKLVQIDREVPDAELMLSTYDSAMFQYPEDSPETLARVVEIMADVQSEPFNLKLPFPVDAKHGRNWAEASL